MANPDVFLENFSKNKELVQIVVNSIANTISSFNHVPVVAGSAEIVPNLDSLKTSVAAAVIRHEGPTLAFELFLSFPKELLYQLFENTFNQVPTSPAEAQDMVGEILNMAFGTIDPMMTGKGHKMRSSFPQSFSGPKLESIKSQLPKRAIEVPLMIQNKKLHLLILAPGTLLFKWGYTIKT